MRSMPSLKDQPFYYYWAEKLLSEFRCAKLKNKTCLENSDTVQMTL